jgi:tRNA threonylcarbamoyladenosine biosynthesis protein TsaB
VITLGIDGALGGFSAAVVRDGTVLAQRQLDGHVALEHGLEAISGAMTDAGASRDLLGRIAVSVGPGGFTGLRIAITFAKALAQAWQLPLAGISSFDVLEHGLDAAEALTVVSGRPGVVSLRFRSGERHARASGLAGDAIAAVLSGCRPHSIPVIGASEDVLGALAEAGWTVTPMAPLESPPAVAVALAGERVRAAASAHDVRADYGEAAAARVPSFRPAPRDR